MERDQDFITCHYNGRVFKVVVVVRLRVNEIPDPDVDVRTGRIPVFE